MWILDSDGDYLQGRRMWLKPGKKYLFGRVKKDGVRVAIDHKTVSRKHFVIEVDAVREEDVGNVRARTRVTVTDENSKAGTSVDGHVIRGQSQELKGHINSVRPGSCSHELIVRWEPCIMTFKMLKKEIKAGALKNKQLRVQDLDIKAVSEYLPGETTHLVAPKRNTAEGLQALIQGRPLVSDSFIEAIVYATTPNDLEQDENLCPLEVDFDEAWPNTAKHLPPIANESTTKPDQAYQPNSARAKIFENFVFVFISQKQHDLLLPPISLGHGKALLYKPQTTDTQEAVTFMQNAASNRKFGQEAVTEEKGAVIMVRIEGDTEQDSWQTTLIDGVARRLGQQAIEQRDFLDAILANNPYQLVRPGAVADSPPYNGTSDKRLVKNPSGEQEPSGTAQHATNGRQLSKSLEENPRPKKRARLFPHPQPVSASFDDDFNPDSIPAYDDEDDADLPTREETGTQSCKQAANLKHESHSPIPEQEPSQNGIDELLTGKAAMDKVMGTQTAPVRNSKANSRNKATKEIKLMDVRKAIQARRKAEAATEQQEHEPTDLEEHDHEYHGPANLVKIVKFDLPVRDKSVGTVAHHHRKGGEWKPEWDGRKNFKKFVRARDKLSNGQQEARQSIKVIVPVAVIRNKNYGMGDQYWDKSQEDKERDKRERERRKKEKMKQTVASQGQGAGRSQRSQTIRNSDDSSSEGDADPGPEATQLQREAAVILDQPVDVNAARRTRADDSKAAHKRPASKPPPARPKKQKTLPVQTLIVHGSDSEEDEGHDSDDMKFTFGRARGQRARG